jgi:hypothetical protein
MPILDFISSIFGPVRDIVTNLHTSDAEKMTLHNEMINLQNQMSGKVLDYETKLMSAQADIIKAEAQGASWIQRNWRPCTMFTFLVLVVCDSFGWLHSPLAPQAWTLLQIGLGGYVAGRSLEKVAPHIASAMNSGDKE